MNKTYQLQASKLYRLRNRRKLAELLGVPRTFFNSEHVFKYDEFSRPKPNGDGERLFTVPEDELKRIQKRICKLLVRIETPEWVISGKRHHSYVTNAERHCDNVFLKTMDISHFYDSASRSYIYKVFKDTFLMANDIAWIVTDLVTYKEILPTGSPSSQSVVFWAYRNMFEKINDIAIKYNCVFTLYVDDMTFSSNLPIPKGLRDEVARELRKNGLIAKHTKDHYYQGKDFKKVTGVGIKEGKLKLPNNRRKKLLDQYNHCLNNPEKKEFDRLKGMLCAARQIEPDIFPMILNYVIHIEKIDTSKNIM